MVYVNVAGGGQLQGRTRAYVMGGGETKYMFLALDAFFERKTAR
jgi:hypothetical protein